MRPPKILCWLNKNLLTVKYWRSNDHRLYSLYSTHRRCCYFLHCKQRKAIACLHKNSLHFIEVGIGWILIMRNFFRFWWIVFLFSLCPYGLLAKKEVNDTNFKRNFNCFGSFRNSVECFAIHMYVLYYNKHINRKGNTMVVVVAVVCAFMMILQYCMYIFIRYNVKGLCSKNECLIVDIYMKLWCKLIFIYIYVRVHRRVHP